MGIEPFDYDQAVKEVLKSKEGLGATYNKLELLTARSDALKHRIDEAKGKEQEYLDAVANEIKELDEATKALQLEVMEHMKHSIADYEASIKRSAALSEKIAQLKLKVISNYKTKQLKLNTYLATSIGIILFIGNQIGNSKATFLGITGIIIFIVAIVSKYVHINKSEYKDLLGEIEKSEAELSELIQYQEKLTAQNEEISALLVKMEKGGEE